MYNTKYWITINGIYTIDVQTRTNIFYVCTYIFGMMTIIYWLLVFDVRINVIVIR